MNKEHQIIRMLSPWFPCEEQEHTGVTLWGPGPMACGVAIEHDGRVTLLDYTATPANQTVAPEELVYMLEKHGSPEEVFLIYNR